MFSGLVLTSISTMVMGAALFQRKSRAGWLEELDGIREDALDGPDGDVGNAMGDPEAIWTDLREGGIYEDPHEISSLYADDETPDLPGAKPAKAPRARKAKAAPSAGATVPPAETVAAVPPAAPEPAPQLAPEPETEAEAEPEVAATRPQPSDDLWGDASARPVPTTSYESEQIWVEPSPHPIRPSEMWHPAELAPSPLGEETFEQTDAEHADASARLRDQLEAELRRAADVTVADAPSARADELPPRAVEPPMVPVDHRDGAPGGLVAGPVGRRVRRDRPTERKRHALPTVESITQSPFDPSASASAALPGVSTVRSPSAAPSEDRGDRSPLPTRPLPPAAMPTRANRLPDLDQLPATPSAVPVGSHPPVVPDPAAIPEPQPEPEPAPEPPAAAAEPVAATVAEDPSVAAVPVVEPPPAPVAIDIAGDGMVAVPGTIVRTSVPPAGVAASQAEHGPVVSLGAGWCWVSPGDGPVADVRVMLPHGHVTIPMLATALVVVERDDSSFVIVADGSVTLQRSGDSVELDRGSIAMLDATGATQVDLASDEEIQADPIVAENLSLDAEL